MSSRTITRKARFSFEERFVLAFGLARVFSRKRKSDSLSVEDVVAGMYVAYEEDLSSFWKTRTAAKTFMAQYCRVSDPVWTYQLEYYDSARKKSWDGFTPFSAELNASFRAAHERAAKRMKSDLTIEDFLLAVSAEPTRLAQALVRTGLLKKKLQSALLQLTKASG
jgi:hypothetical protein